MAPSKDLGFGMLAVVHPYEGKGKAIEPPHVHVYDADGVVKNGLNIVKVLDNKDMKASRVKKAVALVETEKAKLLEMWHASRPNE
jgi:hypothetical protein